MTLDAAREKAILEIDDVLDGLGISEEDAPLDKIADGVRPILEALIAAARASGESSMTKDERDDVVAALCDANAELREQVDALLGTVAHTDDDHALRAAIFREAVGFPPEAKTSEWAERATALGDALDDYMASLVEKRLTAALEARDKMLAARASGGEGRLDALQSRIAEWEQRNFGDAPQLARALIVCEEVGELAHVVLKQTQGIRPETATDAHLRDAMGDIVIALCALAASRGWSLWECVTETAETVLARDWVAERAAYAATTEEEGR